MRGHGLIVVGVFSLVLALPPTAEAQFSPQGIIGAATAPLRHMLGRFGHNIPRFYRHRAAPDARSVANSPAPAATATPAADSWLSRLGPPAWPSAYEDLLGYVFWPDEYAGQIKDRGFDVIADTITGSFAAPAAPAATTGAAARDSAGCDVPSSEQDKWPETRVEQAAQLSGAQQQALEKFQAALVQSTKSLKVDCRNPYEIASPDRLGALIQALWSVRDTGLFVRAPLRAFDDSLTAAQTAAFAGKPHENPQQIAANVKDNAGKDMQACAAQNIGEAEGMIRQVEQRVRPNKDQGASLNNLRNVSANMAKLLTGSCAQPVAADPLARLDAADEQLTTMNYAATTVQIAFDDFYGRLDDQQKARLNSAGR